MRLKVGGQRRAGAFPATPSRITGHATRTRVACFNAPRRYRIGGGAKEDRTPDLLRARQALSQLSYGPSAKVTEVVGLGGFEPPTSPLSGVRSNQLSYRP
jgi:hypothetical protein